MRKSALLFSLIILFVTLSFGQNDWKTKNFETWTMEDVTTILEKSDWVKNQEARIQFNSSEVTAAGSYLPGVVNAGGRGIGNTINQGSIQPAEEVTFTLRLRSSMAIRLALVRKLQLETDTKKLKEAEYATYKKRLRGMYECPACAKNYVITLTSKSSENKNYDAVYRAFAQARLDEVKSYIFLQNEKGEKRKLVHFVPPKNPGDEVTFFFERFDEKSRLLFTKDSKQIIFNSTKNAVSTVANFRIDVAPLIIDERVDF